MIHSGELIIIQTLKQINIKLTKVEYFKHCVMSSVRPLFKEQTHTGVCSPAGWKIDQDTDICLLFAFFRAQVCHSLPDGPQEAIKYVPTAIYPKALDFIRVLHCRTFFGYFLHCKLWLASSQVMMAEYVFWMTGSVEGKNGATVRKEKKQMRKRKDMSKRKMKVRKSLYISDTVQAKYTFYLYINLSFCPLVYIFFVLNNNHFSVYFTLISCILTVQYLLHTVHAYVLWCDSKTYK